MPWFTSISIDDWSTGAYAGHGAVCLKDSEGKLWVGESGHKIVEDVTATKGNEVEEYFLKVRYHYNVAEARLAQHVEKGIADGLLISCVASCTSLWALIMDAGTGFTSQEWIMDQWEKNYYISSIAGSTSGSSPVVMSKGTQYTRQSYKVSDSFPFKWIKQQVERGVLCHLYGYCWKPVVELDFLYPSVGIHRRWDSGYRITSTAATSDQAALILSIPKHKPGDLT
ncbi:hypothetical protein COLO4_11570 [Corchorus olitorius]|uniref:DUF7477 domain-containing protein n=1 Tax=Corchorus olitorius TaxID=93759 RepID=A0A1R3K413_9ROSI|nr:hypothetical protein COLO4_11570 [Corchorus olitorius]